MNTEELQKLLDEIHDRVQTLADEMEHLEPNEDTAGRVCIAIADIANEYQSRLKRIYMQGPEVNQFFFNQIFPNSRT